MYVLVERLLLILPSMHYKCNIILITILIYPEITCLILQKSQAFLKGKNKVKTRHFICEQHWIFETKSVD